MGVHRKKLTKLLIGVIVGNSVPLTLAVISFAWFYSNTRASNQHVDGSVGLREYFYRGDGYIGDGSEQYPHEIVTPLHFYNLTRLQNLGVFPTKTYFRVGHVFEGYESEGPKCLNGDVKVDILDMSSYCANRTLLPVGSEGTPFYGVFDGNHIPIVGLRIAGNPEDIGVFGYTSHTSTIKNIVCKDLEISSKGYSVTGEENFLYSEQIEDIFSQNASNFELASLQFVSTYAEENHTHSLKQVQPFSVDDLYGKSTVINEANSQFNGKRIVQAQIIPSFPTISNHNIEYTISSSAGIIEQVNNSNNLVINLSNLPSDFDAGVPVKMNSHIALVASIKLNSIKYARVIQSYSVEIKQDFITPGQENLGLFLKIECDHTYDNGNPINNGHGNNIGYIVGHADGNVESCYVYNGTMLLNENSEDLENVVTKTDYGLIGKVGNNVTVDIDPTFGATTNGETGVLNFSHVYSLIREPFEEGDQTTAGYTNTYDPQSHDTTGPNAGFVAYAVDQADDAEGKYSPRGTLPATFNMYKEYLRTDSSYPYKHFITAIGGQTDIEQNNIGTGSAYTIPSNITKEMNSVDFTFNKVICDGTGENENRGLGVFKIVTGYSSLANDSNISSLIWRNNIGECSIAHDSDAQAKREIYFSTAECDWTKGGGWSGATGGISPAIMNTLPSFSNVGTFRYPFSRDFDYIFRLDLREAANFKIGNNFYNYMYDTDSEFLKNYLSSKLIDRTGRPVNWKNKAFGFKVQFSQNSTEPVTKLDSYMTIGKPTSLHQYTVNGETKWYPEKSIAFSIDNPNGANVSVAGCGGHISIYSYDPNDNTKPITELYTMRSKSSGAHNMGRFFPYSSTGETNTQSQVLPTGDNMTSSDFLYGHIFTLPKGHYVIGSSSINANSDVTKLYYVAVQGQTNGDLGEIEVTTTGEIVREVDFLLKDPTDVNNPFNVNDSSFFGKFNFAGNFADTIGKFVVDSYELQGALYLRVRFNDFITYLRLKDWKLNPAFIVNNNQPIVGENEYSGPFENLTVWET